MSKEVKKWVAIGSVVLFAVLGVVLGADVKGVVCGVEAPAEVVE